MAELYFVFRPQMVDFVMPENKRDEGENPIVDSLAVASKWTIVSKCALHGLIYVWDLKATLKEIQSQPKKSEGENDKKGEDEEASKVIEQDVVILANMKCECVHSSFPTLTMAIVAQGVRRTIST